MTEGVDRSERASGNDKEPSDEISFAWFTKFGSHWGKYLCHPM